MNSWGWHRSHVVVLGIESEHVLLETILRRVLSSFDVCEIFGQTVFSELMEVLTDGYQLSDVYEANDLFIIEKSRHSTVSLILTSHIVIWFILLSRLLVSSAYFLITLLVSLFILSLYY